MENLGKFKKGDAVKLHGGSYLITDLIGAGMVGEVFRAIDVQRRQRCAVKYNYGNYASNRKLFYEKLLLLTQGRAPHPAFAWPYDAGDRGNNGSFLLAMPLKEGYTSLAPVMRGEASLSPAQRLALARAVVEPFAKLHEAGYLYVDYSQTNIRYRREKDGSFRVAVIDTDNITVPGGNLGLEGTGIFRAPEIILGAKADFNSDYHALSALVFHLLVGCNPLDGARSGSVPFTPENVRKYWGEEPCFLFGGGGNPCRNAQAAANWNALSDKLRAFFSYEFCSSCLHGKLPRLESGMLLQALS